jgi:hypothetical protein
MRSSIYFLLLLVTFSTAYPNDNEHEDHNNHDHDDDQCPKEREGCLSQNDVNHILNNWPRIFDTTDSAWLKNNINCTVTEDFVSNNEGNMFTGKSL